MYVINDIAYANDFNITNLKVTEIKIISALCMLVCFSNGSKRIFDATFLIKFPAYEKLQNFDIFKNATIENGIVVWDNGKIDISADTIYENSYQYEQDIA